MKVVYSPKCLSYHQEGHPETPDRVKQAAHHLKNDFDVRAAEPCKDADILRAHEQQLFDSVRAGTFFDRDTPNLPHMFAHAKLAAGAAIQAAELCLKGEKAFSLMRPPGHHAGRAFLGGFCYFNSIAIAVKKILRDLDRIAILDIDGHHGNGTQDIFLGSEEVLFVSLHQRSAFPLSGFVSERNCINYPLATATGGKQYMQTLEDALEKIEPFNPDVIAVSAGFDTYKDDPLLQLNLGINTFFEIGDAIRQLEKPCFAVLEGGYSKDLPQCVHAFLKGLED
ncbi:MAG: histone deacetylase [Candidatus Aenigmarchaeota archaeon]|nr:histone deacetylase [Candidatus Aenigmarchaeota archaeon]